MTASPVLPRLSPAPPGGPAPVPSGPPSRAAASERVLHRLVRRELRLLGELATRAPAGDAARSAALTRHAELVTRVLLRHHAVERDLLWPALLRAVPADRSAEARRRVTEQTDRCAALDARLRSLTTAARQWCVAGTGRARDAFALACLDLADAVDAQVAAEERDLLPLVAAHLPPEAWTAVIRASRPPLSRRERLLVLGLALEDASPGERARLLAGLPWRTRTAWRLVGRRRYRAACVRLRGEPPAA